MKAEPSLAVLIYLRILKYNIRLYPAMHNLFMGTATYCLELWIKNNILSHDVLKIEEKMSHFAAPHCWKAAT